MNNIKSRLIVMNFLQFAVWGAYLTCVGQFLGRVGLGAYISWFYVAQGVVSIFMPAIMGIIADKYVQPQRLLGISHLLAGGFMLVAAYFGIQATDLAVANAANADYVANIWPIFIPYVLSVAFYMPTIALSNTVAFGTLTRSGLDFVKAFPPIRTLGTVGFIASMWLVNSVSFGLADNAQFTYMQLVLCGVLGVILGAYSFTLPECPLTKSDEKKSLAERLGLDAFVLFKSKTMAMFFIFSMLLGVSLQITNGYATSYINSFQSISSDWFASNPTMLVSISQISEALCILMTAFFLRRFGIKNVMLIAMFAWVLRFGLFGVGTTTTTIGVIALIASCLVYGVAFDFFNVSGAMFVQQEAPQSMQGSAQGLFMLMTNGIGASVGTYIAGKVVDHFCTWEGGYLVSRPEFAAEGWETTWFIFAGYALVVAVAFMLLFRYKHDPKRF
ncbi:MAG: MFS transporter [Alistipes sp.]|nr:MFS transporter [Alistipes sp.]MBQ5924406.1 MFS transporter [Alistipes sp.]